MPIESNPADELRPFLEAVFEADEIAEQNTASASLQNKLISMLALQADQVVIAKRQGSQLSANAFWQGEWSPAKSPKKKLGVGIATDGLDVAVQGAIRRMRLDVEFPEVVVVLNPHGTPSLVTHVACYDDVEDTAAIASVLNYPEQNIQRVPRFLAEQTVSDTQPAVSSADAVVKHLLAAHNIVLQGPPGTGKTLAALNAISAIAGGSIHRDSLNVSRLLDDHDGDLNKVIAMLSASRPPVVWEMVQLHPGYSYDDLVRRMVPKSDGGNLAFEAEDQTLPILCRIAQSLMSSDDNEPDVPVILVLDEVNRADLSAVLGELLMSIEPAYRGTPVRIQYQSDHLSPTITVPRNLYVIGTMNTADRTIAMVDYAVRRRFRFLDVLPNESALRTFYATSPKRGEVAAELLSAFNEGLKPINGIGHSYFMVPAPEGQDAVWADQIGRRAAYEAHPMLLEYVAEGLRGEGPIRFAGVEFRLEDRNEVAKLVESIGARLGNG